MIWVTQGWLFRKGRLVMTPESSAARMAAVLLALGGDVAADEGEMRVSDIARAVGRENSQVSRMLRSLAMAGLVERNARTRGYRLSRQLVSAAMRIVDHQLMTHGRATVTNLAKASGESSVLTVLQGKQTLTILRENSRYSLQAGCLGRLSPLHVTASGRALLFDAPPWLVQALVGDAVAGGPYGPNAATDVEGVMRRLDVERQWGVAIAVDELEEGLVAVAAPVRDALGHVVGAINIEGPRHRVRGHVKTYGPLVIAASSSLSAKLGHVPQRSPRAMSLSGAPTVRGAGV